jgi:AraC-type DNA-binding domain-containing proteins
LIEQAKTMQSDMQFIILTAYDHFRYAQQAVRLGVSDFLLKPCSEQQMREVILAVLDRLQISRDARARQLSWGVEDWLRGRADVETLRALLASHGIYPPPRICILAWHQENIMPIAGDMCAWVFWPLGRRYMIIGHDENAAIPGTHTICPVGKSQGGALEALRSLFTQALSALEDKWYYDSPRVMLWENATNGTREAMQKAQICFEELNDKTKEVVHRKIEDYLRSLKGKPGCVACTHAVLEQLYTQLNKQSVHRQLDNAPTMPELAQHQGWETVLARFFDDYDAVCAAYATQRAKDPITWAKQYIRANLSATPDMAVIANELDISYTYFSKLFKEQTGKTFSEYLMQERMQEAEHQLCAGRRVGDVAKTLGYQSIQNFSRAFFKHFGYRPNTARSGRR